jgi:hypothetical protein
MADVASYVEITVTARIVNERFSLHGGGPKTPASEIVLTSSPLLRTVSHEAMEARVTDAIDEARDSVLGQVRALYPRREG